MSTISTSNDALNALELRINKLEQILSDKVNLSLHGEEYSSELESTEEQKPQPQPSPSLYTQLENLNNSIDSLILHDPNLINLVDKLTTLKLWPLLQPLDFEDKESPDTPITLEQKIQIVFSRENELKAFAKSMDEILKKSHLVDANQGAGAIRPPTPTTSSPPSWNQLGPVLSQLTDLEKRLVPLVQTFEELSISTGQTFHEWLEKILIKDNRLWFEIDQKVELIERSRRREKARNEI